MEGGDKLQVFISSVMGGEDLTAERARVRHAITELKLTRPWAFEFSPAQSSPADQVYLSEVSRSDLLVCIVSRTHSAAVQAELEAAYLAGVPVLAFVRRLETGFQEAKERNQVLGWLASRVKYDVFSSTADLGERVTSAIVLELVRGYRHYRMLKADLSLLVDQAPSPRGLLLRQAEIGDRPELELALRELVQWYPNIGVWSEKVLRDLGSPSDVRVADVEGQIAGLAVSRDKEVGVRKYSTLYVRPGFQGGAIGPHLIYEEVRRAGKEGVRKAYVTFADELRESIGPILSRYGFQYEGVSAGRYRPGSAEWVMGRTFSHEIVDASRFRQFILDHYIHECGGVITTSEGPRITVRLPAVPLLGNVAPVETHLVLSTSPIPEEEYEKFSKELGEARWIFLSLYGRPADIEHWSNRVTNWVDGADLSARYYPVKLMTPEQPSIICTIKPQYADALVPTFERPALFPPSRLQVRPDNVYYRAPDRYAGLRRGSTVFFYVSSQRSNCGDGRYSKVYAWVLLRKAWHRSAQWES